MRFLYSLLLFASLSLYGINPEKESEKIWSTYISTLPPSKHRWISKCEVSYKDFGKYLTSPKRAEDEYERSKDLSKYFTRTKITGLSSENLKKNRYQSVVPFDDVRTLRDVPGFYLCASDIVTEDQAYIVTSAPQRHTLSDFWKAILETKTTTIVQLVASSESKSSAPIYYKKSLFPFYVDDWKIELEDDKILAQSVLKPKQKIVERLFTARRKDGKKRQIRHLHYENWPDGGSPDSDLFYKLLEFVDEKQKSSDPILVHCMAGVGRSGTFVLGHTLRRQVIRNRNKKRPFNIAKTFLLIRMQREKLISTSNQFQAALIAALIEYEKGG